MNWQVSQLLHSTTVLAPVHDANVGPRLIIVCQPMHGQLADNFLGLHGPLMQAVIPENNLARRLLNQVPEGYHEWGGGQEGCQLVHKPKP